MFALLGGQSDLTSVPAEVVPRNEIESLVLRNPVGNGPLLEWLEAHAGDAGLEAALAKAGFERSTDERGCQVYDYLRVVKPNGQKRVASIFLCKGKKPNAMVLMTFPVILGRGKRIFDGSQQPHGLKLVDIYAS